jgi:hypothetical protein
MNGIYTVYIGDNNEGVTFNSEYDSISELRESYSTLYLEVRVKIGKGVTEVLTPRTRLP